MNFVGQEFQKLVPEQDRQTQTAATERIATPQTQFVGGNNNNNSKTKTIYKSKLHNDVDESIIGNTNKKLSYRQR